MKRHLSCGLSRPWHQVSFVRPPNAGRVGVHSNCIKRKGRSNGEEPPAEHSDQTKRIHQNSCISLLRSKQEGFQSYQQHSTYYVVVRYYNCTNSLLIQLGYLTLPYQGLLHSLFLLCTYT